MQIEINPKGGVPIYVQIINQIKYLVASGRLSPGEEILPIRTLAEQLVINPNTVARAYMELEREGILVKRHGTGTYVADRLPSTNRAHRQKILTEHADALLLEARQLGVELEGIVELLRARHAKLQTATK